MVFLSLKNMMNKLPTIETLVAKLGTSDAIWETWRNSVPDKHWVKMDLSALRVGYELGKLCREVTDDMVECLHDTLPMSCDHITPRQARHALESALGLIDK